MTDTTPAIAAALAALRADLLLLHAEAEAANMPQNVVMGLHWFCEDAASTLMDLHNLATRQTAA